MRKDLQEKSLHSASQISQSQMSLAYVKKQCKLFLLHLVLFTIFLKILDPHMGLAMVFWIVVFVTIIMIAHELGHVMVWTLMGVRTIKFVVIPMIGMGVLPDYEVLGRKPPLSILLAVLAGPVANLALAFYVQDKYTGWFPTMFVAFSFVTFAGNIIPLPFTDGAYGAMLIFRTAMSIKVSFWRLMGITTLVLLTFMKWQSLVISVLALMILLGLQLLVLKIRNDKKILFIEGMMINLFGRVIRVPIYEIMLAVYIGLGFVLLDMAFAGQYQRLIDAFKILWHNVKYYLAFVGL